MESVIKEIGGEECGDRVRDVFDQMDDMIYGGRGEELGDLMNHCGPVNVTSDLSVAAFIQHQIEFFNQWFNVHQ